MKLEHETKYLTLDFLIQEIQAKKIVYCAKKKPLWSVKQREKYIDSFFDNWPCSPIVLCEYGNDDNVKLIDGFERISAILDFFSDKFELDYYKFSEMPLDKQREFLTSVIDIVIIDVGKRTMFAYLNDYHYTINMIRQNNDGYVFDIGGRFVEFQNFLTFGAKMYQLRLLAKKTLREVSNNCCLSLSQLSDIETERVMPPEDDNIISDIEMCLNADFGVLQKLKYVYKIIDSKIDFRSVPECFIHTDNTSEDHFGIAY